MADYRQEAAVARAKDSRVGYTGGEGWLITTSSHVGSVSGRQSVISRHQVSEELVSFSLVIGKQHLEITAEAGQLCGTWFPCWLG